MHPKTGFPWPFSLIEPVPFLVAWQNLRCYDFTQWLITFLVDGATFIQKHSLHPSVAMKWVSREAPSSIQPYNSCLGRILTGTSCSLTLFIKYRVTNASHREGDATFQWLPWSLSFLLFSHVLITTSIHLMKRSEYHDGIIIKPFGSCYNRCCLKYYNLICSTVCHMLCEWYWSKHKTVTHFSIGEVTDSAG